mmetsp:Transcript_127512/g.369150  ORF Transcript_127512/g.369150 Transcript_127512/m.369150 type:complete len:468 (+) Transcript_127512:922-2325(+)
MGAAPKTLKVPAATSGARTPAGPSPRYWPVGASGVNLAHWRMLMRSPSRLIGSPSSSISSIGKPSMSHSMASPSRSSELWREALVSNEPTDELCLACSRSCQCSSWAASRSMSHSFRASSSGSSRLPSRCEVDDLSPRDRHIFSNCEKCCRLQSASFGSSHGGSRDESPLAAKARSRFTPTTSAASSPRTNWGVKSPQSSHMCSKRLASNRACSEANLLSSRAMAKWRCSKMSGNDRSNSRRYAQAEGLELAVLCKMSLTTRRRAILRDMSVSMIVNDSVMHSAISMAHSLLSRQKAIVSRIVLRDFVTLRSSCSKRSQSVSVKRLPPAMPRLSRSRRCRSKVARSSRRWRSTSSSKSSLLSPANADEVDRVAGFGAGAACPTAGLVDALLPPTANCPCAACGGAAVRAACSRCIGPDEKLVLRSRFSTAASHGGGLHHAPSSQRRNVCVRQTLKLSPWAKANVLQR